MEGGGGWEQGKERRGDAVEGEEVGGGAINHREVHVKGRRRRKGLNTL